MNRKKKIMKPTGCIRPRSNVQNIHGIFQKLLHKSAAAHGQNTLWNIPLYAAVCCVFVPFVYGIL